MWQADCVQGDLTQSVIKASRFVRPLPAARQFLRLSGLFAGQQQSAIRRWHSGRLTLRLRFDAAVTVSVQRRKISRWTETEFIGQDAQSLLPEGNGEDVRLVVNGFANGFAELV